MQRQREWTERRTEGRREERIKEEGGRRKNDKRQIKEKEERKT